eukprot:TRINITY_DN81274_c0_g1_i1.p1 TRINITY_DN81274_c0_g1~~TRINITY_DN81274_c0_g1_i1.p1  ORF type:complete len:317 (+),score=43.17 TRINITY_DN81274_c0_g1_i1:84-1034(+)
MGSQQSAPRRAERAEGQASKGNSGAASNVVPQAKVPCLPIANRRTRGITLQAPPLVHSAPPKSAEEPQPEQAQSPKLEAARPAPLMLPLAALPVTSRTRRTCGPVAAAEPQSPAGFAAAWTKTQARLPESQATTSTSRKFVHFSGSPVSVMEYTPYSAYSTPVRSPMERSPTTLSSEPIPSPLGSPQTCRHRTTMLSSPLASPAQQTFGQVVTNVGALQPSAATFGYNTAPPAAAIPWTATGPVQPVGTALYQAGPYPAGPSAAMPARPAAPGVTISAAPLHMPFNAVRVPTGQLWQVSGAGYYSTPLLQQPSPSV